MLNDLDLKEDLFNAQKGEEDIEKIGFTVVFNIFSKATTKEAQQMIYKVLAEPFEMKPNEVGLMEFDKLFEAIKECFNLETTINFIKRAISQV